jgi:hypothetical protein
MHTYEVRLSPRPGTGGSNITVVIQAGSDMEARRIAEASIRLTALRPSTARTGKSP